MEKFKKHPVDVYKNRRMRLTRIHALEIARRAMESGQQEEVPPSPQMPGQGPPQGGMPPGMSGMPEEM